MFFDSRITQHMPESAPHKSRRDRLILAFSDRWMRPKGIEHAVAAFKRARASSDRDLRVEHFGSGPYAPDSPVPDGITAQGNVD